jgi:hypothetical protein
MKHNRTPAELIAIVRKVLAAEAGEQTLDDLADELIEMLEAALATKAVQITALAEALRELEPAAKRLCDLTNLANKEPGASAQEWHETRQAINRARVKALAALAKATD